MSGKHDDKTRFIVAVLYACGDRTEKEIAAAMKLTRGAVSGIINRAGNLRRATATERQAFLDKARARRLDQGALEDRFFVVRDIERRKR